MTRSNLPPRVALFGCLFAADAAAQLPGEASPPAIVAISTLPRLRQVWTLNGLETTQWRYQEGAPVFDGTLIAWSTSANDNRLVAIDLATGKERWRSAEPWNAPGEGGRRAGAGDGIGIIGQTEIATREEETVLVPPTPSTYPLTG